MQGRREVVVAMDDNAGVNADDVQLSLKLDGRDQQLETTRLNSRTLMFTAPSKQSYRRRSTAQNILRYADEM